MQLNAQIYSVCNKIFNSEQQLKAYNVSKKLKCNYETASKGKVKESELIIYTNPNSFHEDIHKYKH